MRDATCPSCGHKFPLSLRSTGKYSQNHGIWGFADQIARWKADGTTKVEVVDEAMRRAGVEAIMNDFGRMVYRESALTKEEASMTIDALREIADFVGCRLVDIAEEGI